MFNINYNSHSRTLIHFYNIEEFFFSFTQFKQLGSTEFVSRSTKFIQSYNLKDVLKYDDVQD